MGCTGTTLLVIQQTLAMKNAGGTNYALLPGFYLLKEKLVGIRFD